MLDTTETRSVKLSEVSKYAKHHFKTKRPMFVWGPPGIGKSETFQQIVADYNKSGKKAKLIDCRLALWDPTDLKGYPYYDPESNKMKFSAPDELPDEEMAAEYDIIVLPRNEGTQNKEYTILVSLHLILSITEKSPFSISDL